MSFSEPWKTSLIFKALYRSYWNVTVHPARVLSYFEEDKTLPVTDWESLFSSMEAKFPPNRKQENFHLQFVSNKNTQNKNSLQNNKKT